MCTKFSYENVTFTHIFIKINNKNNECSQTINLFYKKKFE